MAITGPTFALCRPVAEPLVVAVFPVVRPPPVMLNPNWSPLENRLVMFFWRTSVGFTEQAPRSTLRKAWALEESAVGPAKVAPLFGFSLVTWLTLPLVASET